MSEHTPGPWTIDWEDDGLCVSAATEEDGTHRHYVHHGCGEYETRDEAERQANARLIAAAPDMLEALELAATYFGPPRRWDEPPECAEDECARVIQNAIRKANGEAI